MATAPAYTTGGAGGRGVRALPPPLLIALCVAILSSLAIETRGWPASLVIGVGLMSSVFQLYGAVILARRSAGAVRAGLCGFAAAQGVMVLHPFASLYLYDPMEGFSRWLSRGYVASSGLIAVSLAIALWRSSRVLALALAVIYVGVAWVPDHFIGPGIEGVIAKVQLLQDVLVLCALVWIARAAPAPRPAKITGALHQAFIALWLIQLLITVTWLCQRSNAPVALRVYAVDLWLGALCVVWLGISVARASRTPGSSLLLASAGAILTSCGAGIVFVATAQTLIWLGHTPPITTPLREVAPLVILAPLGGAMLAAALARCAGATDRLRRRATWSAVGIAAMCPVAYLTVDDLVVSPSSGVAFIAAASMLAASMLLAHLCKRAGDVVDRTPASLPAARVV